MSKSLTELLYKYRDLDLGIVREIYFSARNSLLLELKEKVMGYPVNGVLKGVILEEDIDMWIFEDKEFHEDLILVEKDKQSKFELSHVPIKGSIIGYIMPAKILTVDIEIGEGKTCHVKDDYAELLEQGDVIAIHYGYLKDEQR